MIQFVPQIVLRFAARLRFPQLFFIALGLFVIDLLMPDVIPFADEILLGLLPLLAASLRKRIPKGRVIEGETEGQ